MSGNARFGATNLLVTTFMKRFRFYMITLLNNKLHTEVLKNSLMKGIMLVKQI